MNTTSHREKKKLETKEAIALAAENLFIKNGYQATTLADIASLANVSQRTIFSYFASKESIIFYKKEQSMRELIEFLECKKSGDTLTSLRIYIKNHMIGISKDQYALEMQRCKLIESNTELSEYSASIMIDLENRFVKLIADERQISTESIQAHMIAAICRATFNYSNTLHPENNEDILDKMIKFIDGGLRATSGLQ